MSQQGNAAAGVVLTDVRAQTVTISGVTIGLTAPEVQELTKAAAASAVGPLAETIMDLSLRLGVTQGAMRTMLATVGQADVSDDRLIDKLTEVVVQYGKASAAIVALRPDNPAAQQHVVQASEAAAVGDRYQARQHLRAAKAAAETAAADAQRLAWEAKAAATKQMLQAAQAVAAEAELSLAALDYPEAANLFAEAAALVPPSEPAEQGILVWRQADALHRHGEERGHNVALRQAVALYDQALAKLPRDHSAAAWAQAQNDRGAALAALGERENGTAALEDAVNAFQAALEERTRDRAPNVWAMTQNNLGRRYGGWANARAAPPDLSRRPPPSARRWRRRRVSGSRASGP